MQTVKLSCARTGSAVGREAGFWRAPPKGRPGPADRVPGPTPVCAPWDHPTRGAPALVSLPVTRGRRGGIGRRSGCPGREVRVLLDLHGLLLYSLEILSTRAHVPSPAWGTVTASLAVLGRVDVASVGLQRRFDLLQD